jgi:hypothetical protein
VILTDISNAEVQAFSIAYGSRLEITLGLGILVLG